MSKFESYHFYKSFSVTRAGFITPIFTGLLSACSSGLIVYIISKSQQKLSTTYHRLMAFMSAFDIISSIFVAVGSTMMPSDNIYKFEGPMLGNKVTCQIQGWLIVFALLGATSLYACLTWYFVCSIAFTLESTRIRKHIEPLMYSYSIIIASFVPSYYLSKDLINPNPNDIFCTISPYPESCDDEKWYDWSNCTWSDGIVDEYFSSVVVAVGVLLFHFILIVVGMSIILWTVHKNRQEINAMQLECNNDETMYDDNDEREESQNAADMRDLKTFRVVMLQALMYIAAFFLTWSFNFFSEVFNIANYTLDACNCVFFPLQGFWNLLIFLFDKTYFIQQRQRGEEVTFYKAIKAILSSPSDAPELIVSNISTVIESNEPPSAIRLVDRPSYVSDVLDSMIGSEYDDISQLRENVSINHDILSSSSPSYGYKSELVSFKSSVASAEQSIARAEMTNVRNKFKPVKKERNDV
jgi:hypothetical protein